MSDRTTYVGRRSAESAEPRVRISGISDWGRQTRPDMLRKFREYYARQLAEAEAALALTDDELIVETYVGAWAQRDRKEVVE